MNCSRDGARYGRLVESVPRAAAKLDGAQFAANPGRTARVRPATTDEAELACLRFGWPEAPGTDLQYAVVAEIHEPPGAVRIFATPDLDGLGALSDDMAGCLLSGLCGRRGDPRRIPVVSVDGSAWVLR